MQFDFRKKFSFIEVKKNVILILKCGNKKK